MQTLTALNQLLIAAGESQVLSIDEGHPLQELALTTLDDVSRLEQSNGYWFNQYDTTLTPDVSGHLVVPAGTVKVQTRAYADERVILRGTMLLNKDTRSTVFSHPMAVTITEEWDFEELPQTFAQYVVALAAVVMSTGLDADAAKIQTLTEKVSMARIPMHKEHVQNSHVNMLSTPSMQSNLGPIRGFRYSQR